MYDAQVYLLLKEAESEEAAREAAEQWREMAQQTYAVDGTAEQTHNGQDFTVTTYTFDSADNPYARGASACGVYRNFALNVELTCREEFDGDAAELLAQFLGCCRCPAFGISCFCLNSCCMSRWTARFTLNPETERGQLPPASTLSGRPVHQLSQETDRPVISGNGI